MPTLGDVSLGYQVNHSKVTHSESACTNLQLWAISSPFIISLDVYPDDPIYGESTQFDARLQAGISALIVAAAGWIPSSTPVSTERKPSA